jgi:hypothetical protein
MEIQIYFLYTLQFDENTLQLVHEYPSPSPNKGLPLKEERLKIFIKSLEKLLIEITLLIFLNYVPGGTSFWRCSGWWRQNQRRFYHGNWD